MTQRTNLRDIAVTGFEPAGSSPVAVAWPETESGDRVFLLCSGELNGTNNFTPAGSWTSLGKTGGGTGITFEVFELDGDATGSEVGTFEVALSNLADHSFICVSVANPVGATEVQFTSDTSGAMDPSSITPSGGERHYSFIVGAVIDFARDIFSWPADYDHWVSDARGTERLAFCFREGVETTEDPGAFSNPSDGWAAATIAIPTTAPDPSNFPNSEGRATSEWLSSSTSQSMNHPADIQVGELLVAEVTAESAATAAISGWDVVGSDAAPGQVAVTILAKEADGTEGATSTVTLSGSVLGSAICSRVSGATIEDIEAAFATTGDTRAPDPPPLIPAAGSAEILWLVGIGAHSGSSNTIEPQLFPIGFGSDITQVQHSEALGASMASGFGAYETATVDPPAAFVSHSQETVSYTVAIYPAGGATEPEIVSDPAVEVDDAHDGTLSTEPALTSTQATEVTEAHDGQLITELAIVSDLVEVVEVAQSGTLATEPTVTSIPATEADEAHASTLEPDAPPAPEVVSVPAIEVDQAHTGSFVTELAIVSNLALVIEEAHVSQLTTEPAIVGVLAIEEDGALDGIMGFTVFENVGGTRVYKVSGRSHSPGKRIYNTATRSHG